MFYWARNCVPRHKYFAACFLFLLWFSLGAQEVNYTHVFQINGAKFTLGLIKAGAGAYILKWLGPDLINPHELRKLKNLKNADSRFFSCSNHSSYNFRLVWIKRY